MTRALICCAIAMLLTSNAAADLVVLYDSGASQSIDRYLKPLRARSPSRAANRTVANTNVVDALLPIRSPSLTPGPVKRRAFETPVPVAFFMIGSDPRSLDWLVKHRDTLRRLGAVGLLVAASTEKDLDAVAVAADGLAITPASGEDIAASLNISHYPVAISDGQIWQ